MELTFSSNTKTYLKEVFHEVRCQEETAEINVPDSLPDVAGISCCHASVNLRDKECRNGSATVSGAVNAGAIYVPEDGSHARLLEFYIPFTVKFDHTDIADNSQVIAEVKICNVDTRMINSRKIMLRANVGCQITVYNTATYNHYELQNTDERLQTKRKTMEFCLPMEMSEKLFTVGDSFEVPSTRPPVVQVCKTHCDCEMIDQKLVGNKAIFKGILHCKLLYRSEDNEFYTWSQQLPFSQYCELRDDYEEDLMSVHPAIAGCDVTTETDDMTSILNITVSILSQCIVSSSHKMELVEDGYCIRGVLQPEWSRQTLPCYLDWKQEQISLRHSLRGDLQQVIDTDIYIGFPSYKKDETGVDLSLPVNIKVLGLDANDRLVGIQTRDDISAHYALDRDASCIATVCPVEDLMVQPSSNGADIRCNVPVRVVFSAMQQLNSMCSGTIEDLSPYDSRRPSITLRNITQEEPLWDIAKAFSTTVDALQKSNGIDQEYTPAHGMLLIPAE